MHEGRDVVSRHVLEHDFPLCGIVGCRRLAVGQGAEALGDRRDGRIGIDIADHCDLDRRIGSVGKIGVAEAGEVRRCQLLLAREGLARIVG